MEKLKTKLKRIEDFEKYFEIEKIVDCFSDKTGVLESNDLALDLKFKRNVLIDKEKLDQISKKIYSINRNIITIQYGNIYSVISDY